MLTIFIDIALISVVAVLGLLELIATAIGEPHHHFNNTKDKDRAARRKR
jgi:hypothetical protein